MVLGTQPPVTFEVTDQTLDFLGYPRLARLLGNRSVKSTTAVHEHAANRGDRAFENTGRAQAVLLRRYLT